MNRSIIARLGLNCKPFVRFIIKSEAGEFPASLRVNITSSRALFWFLFLFCGDPYSTMRIHKDDQFVFPALNLCRKDHSCRRTNSLPYTKVPRPPDTDTHFFRHSFCTQAPIILYIDLNIMALLYIWNQQPMQASPVSPEVKSKQASFSLSFSYRFSLPA